MLRLRSTAPDKSRLNLHIAMEVGLYHYLTLFELRQLVYFCRNIIRLYDFFQQLLLFNRRPEFRRVRYLHAVDKSDFLVKFAYIFLGFYF